MISNTKIKIEDAIQNAQQYIAEMEKMDDKKLSKHLDLVQIQKQMAYKQKNEEAFVLLSEYENQIIQARVNKNNPSYK